MANVTIYSLAKELNMTPSMVSRALNPGGKVSEEKRRLVLTAAKKYGFSPNKFASRLSMKTLRIGIIMNNRYGTIKEQMLSGIEEAHRQLKDYKINYDITILNPETSGADEYSDAMNKYADCDGIILSGMSSEKYAPLIRSALEQTPNIVQVQATNDELDCLFSSKHNEATASAVSAEFLHTCLRQSPRKNILLFTGDMESVLHKKAKEAFSSACEEYGLNLCDSVDMKDNEKYFKDILPSVFEKHEGEIDGIYITSGISLPLCEYLYERKIEVPLVVFDVHDHIKEYMKKGVVCAAIFQNVSKQMETAFTQLSKHIISGDKCEKVIYTDIHLVLKSNMRQYD